MPKRESALIALFHVRRRPLYCKQLRASLFGLSGWALEYFPPSPATACHKGTSVADNTEVATVFFVSLRVSHKLFSMQASFLSPPPHFLEALFFLSSAVPLSGPYWEDRDRHSAQPKVCLPVWSALLWNKSALTLPTHSNPPPQTSPQQTPTFSLNSLFLRYLLSPLPFNDKAFTSKDHPLFCTVGTFLIFITSNDYCCLSCASELNEKKQQRTCPRKLKAKYSCTTYFILKDILNNDFVVTHWPVNWM